MELNRYFSTVPQDKPIARNAINHDDSCALLLDFQPNLVTKLVGRDRQGFYGDQRKGPALGHRAERNPNRFGPMEDRAPSLSSKE